MKSDGENDGVKTFRDLMVWQKSMTLVAEIYKLSKSFPSEEIYGLTAQIRRSAVSIPSNIAEGFGRNSTVDFVRFLRIAEGSLYEFQTQLEIALNLGYFSAAQYDPIFESSREVERMLTSLIRKLSTKSSE